MWIGAVAAAPLLLGGVASWTKVGDWHGSSVALVRKARNT